MKPRKLFPCNKASGFFFIFYKNILWRTTILFQKGFWFENKSDCSIILLYVPPDNWYFVLLTLLRKLVIKVASKRVCLILMEFTSLEEEAIYVLLFVFFCMKCLPVLCFVLKCSLRLSNIIKPFIFQLKYMLGEILLWNHLLKFQDFISNWNTLKMQRALKICKLVPENSISIL